MNISDTVYLYEIPTPTDEHLEMVDNKYESWVFGENKTAMDKYFVNECLDVNAVLIKKEVIK